MSLWTRVRRMFSGDTTVRVHRAPAQPDDLDRRVASVQAKARRVLERGRTIEEVRRLELHMRDRKQ